jgi:hypothetical protein
MTHKRVLVYCSLEEVLSLVLLDDIAGDLRVKTRCAFVPGREDGNRKEGEKCKRLHGSDSIESGDDMSRREKVGWAQPNGMRSESRSWVVGGGQAEWWTTGGMQPCLCMERLLYIGLGEPQRKYMHTPQPISTQLASGSSSPRPLFPSGHRR